MTVTLTPTRTQQLRELAAAALRRCGGDPDALPGAERVEVVSPVTGEPVAAVPFGSAEDVDRAVTRAHAAFLTWRTVPAPVRGRLVKRFGELLTEHRSALADLIGVEVGKIVPEALGEVQEMIDVCDLAVGLSRQLEGRTLPSERPGHRLMETWHPLGVVAVVSAFNFPAAVWAWNAAIALVCGDTVVWKPSERTPLVAVAAAALLERAGAGPGRGRRRDGRGRRRARPARGDPDRCGALRAAGAGADAGADQHRADRDVRAAPARAGLRRAG